MDTTPDSAPQTSSRPPAFALAGASIPAGRRVIVEVPIPGAYGFSDLTLPVTVAHGRRPGPVLLVSAAIHGDEVLGAEVIRRLLAHSALRRLRGTLVAVPVVNIYGFAMQSRYLPDRRDLNRHFPGSPSGSLAARLAHTFMSVVASACNYAIDLHTAAISRTNLPQVRGWLDDPRTRELCLAFGAPVVIKADLRDGSLRAALREADIPVVLFEGGEALRYDESAIRAALDGVLGVMGNLDMIQARRRPTLEPLIAEGSYWVRAAMSGLVRSTAAPGTRVMRKQQLGTITDPLRGTSVHVHARGGGIVIGCSTNPVVNEGDALYHIAAFAGEDLDGFASSLSDFDESLHEIDHLGPDAHDGAEA